MDEKDVGLAVRPLRPNELLRKLATEADAVCFFDGSQGCFQKRALWH
jgi:hypothetical protein